MNAQQVGTDKRDSHTFYQFQPTVSNTKSQKRLQSFLAANQTEVLSLISTGNGGRRLLGLPPLLKISGT